MEIEATPSPTPEGIETVPIPEGKVYSIRAMTLAIFLGGPLIVGYMMAANFIVFGENKKANWTFFWSIITFIVTSAFLIYTSAEILSKILFSLLFLPYVFFASFAINHFQRKKIIIHFKLGGKKNKSIKILLISSICSVIICITMIFISLSSALNSTPPLILKPYKEGFIAYNPQRISGAKVDTIGNIFTRIGYFNNTTTKCIAITSQKGNQYEIKIYLSNIKTIEAATLLKKQVDSLSHGIKLVLLVVPNNDVNNVLKRLE